MCMQADEGSWEAETSIESKEAVNVIVNGL
jgi:hypothetical protein